MPPRPQLAPALLGLCAALSSLLVAAQPARADRQQLTLSLAPGLSALRVGDQMTLGGGGTVDVSYGITDALALRTTFGATAQSVAATAATTTAAADPGGVLAAWQAAVGVTYTVDILRLVPSIDLGVGLLAETREAAGVTTTQLAPAVEIGLGVDYLVTRRFSVGVIVRYHAFLTAVAEIPIYLFVGPRVAYRFGG